jgi:hypothetical protein
MFLEALSKTTDIFSIASVPAKIQTEHLRAMSWELPLH